MLENSIYLHFAHFAHFDINEHHAFLALHNFKFTPAERSVYMEITNLDFNAYSKPQQTFTHEIVQSENHTQIIGDTNIDYIDSDNHSLPDDNSSTIIEVSLNHTPVDEPDLFVPPSLFLLSPPGTSSFAIQQATAYSFNTDKIIHKIRALYTSPAATFTSNDPRRRLFDKIFDKKYRPPVAEWLKCFEFLLDAKIITIKAKTKRASVYGIVHEY